MSEVRVRFAPSPTGSLHVGGARTAIYNWAFARRHQGKFILRIEDTDPERSTVQNTEQIMRSLAWLGLDWDEGPGVGGEAGPYLQTERYDLYHSCLQLLQAEDGAYPCFCTAEELAERRQAATESATGPSGYDRCCRDISKEEATRRIENHEPHTWRLKLRLNQGPVVFQDAVYGEISVPYQQMDDFILVRSDGSPTYNFACVVDDLAMGITHVIRGDDHLSNTPKQILIYAALKKDPPVFAHLSMILGADGARLSKRHGATSVEAYRDAGYLPEALMNYLALLGWSLDGETTLIDPQKLCENFTLQRVSRNPAVFDPDKLDWINASYIKQMEARAFIDALSPWLAEAGLAREGHSAAPETVMTSIANNRAWYEAIYNLIAERIKTLAEAPPMISYLFSGDSVELDQPSVSKCLQLDGIAAVLDEACSVLADSTLAWDHQSIETSLRQLPDQLGIKPKTLFQAIRVAICGNMVSPPL
ncbi:MAG: glutamate--tRNA ligase, partial [Coriobacteriales bacterium]|nr:glutamate--tRNA ligase [Coriobacteriales bacterium]